MQVNGLLRDDPVREWEIHVFPGNGQARQYFGRHPQPCGGARGGLRGSALNIEFAIVGPRKPASTAKANGNFSTANGVTYVVLAEGPDGRLAALNRSAARRDSSRRRATSRYAPTPR